MTSNKSILEIFDDLMTTYSNNLFDLNKEKDLNCKLKSEILRNNNEIIELKNKLKVFQDRVLTLNDEIKFKLTSLQASAQSFKANTWKFNFYCQLQGLY